MCELGLIYSWTELSGEGKGGCGTGGDQGCFVLYGEPFGSPEQNPASDAMCCACTLVLKKKKLQFSQWLLSIVSLPLAKC